MPEGLLGRDAVLRVVHQQLLQQVLPFWTQVRYELDDACPFLHCVQTIRTLMNFRWTLMLFCICSSGDQQLTELWWEG